MSSPVAHPLLASERLLGIRRGIEKESLRALPDGKLALTPHPLALGSALTHPHITTDYSESQLELITGVHAGVQACLDELVETHQYTYRTLQEAGQEMLWVSSMPCGLPTGEEEQIQQIVLRAYQVLGCRGWARADVMIDARTRKPYLLEINTSPGMTGHSLVPMSAKAAGISYEDLCILLLQAATLEHGGTHA